MYILLYIFGTILSLIVLILIIALFVKPTFTIRREVIINRSKADVFSYIRLLNNQVYYNIWVMMDPNVKRSSRGIDGTVGFYSAWDSDHKQVGKGEQEIKGIIEEERIDLQIHFIKPFEGMGNTYMTTEAISDNQTKLVWVFNGSNKYPKTLMNLMMDKLLGGDIETSLSTLKKVLET